MTYSLFKNKNYFFGLYFFTLALSYQQNSFADENGQLIGKTENCQASVFSSIQKVCQLVDKLGASCKITADQCVSAQQEVFTGNLIEFASPKNIKAWNGFGGMGEPYSKATTCLMRDIADLPQQKISTHATANTLLGSVSAIQEVGFLSFNKNNAAFEGYHRLQACGPVVGCIDAYTQKFKLTPLKSNTQGKGLLAGQYEIREAHSLDLWADGLSQGILVQLPGVNVPTPVGPIIVTPEFRFGRATGFITAPYDGNFKSSLPDTALGETKNQTYDVYGRNPGSKVSTLSPIDTKPGSAGWFYNPKAWISQIALGSRDANPKNAVWKAPPGIEFPLRPDANIKQARSIVEKTPNAYLGASLEAKYSIVNLLPAVLLNLGCSGFVKICIEDASVFAKPTIDIGFMSQINFFQNEQIRWNKKTFDNGALPIPNLQPQNMDQVKSATIFSAASTAARFALDAGLDLVIRLKINGVFTSINKLIVNIHPRTTIAEKIDTGYSDSKIAMARSQASKIFKENKLFQHYLTFKGVNEAASSGDGGFMHVKSCLSKPSATGSMPTEPTYTPGNPEQLVEVIEYPCNICVGWEDISYLDDNKKPQVEKGQVGTILPASQDGIAPEHRWKCKFAFQSGCYDMCKMNSSGLLTVTRTALQMLSSGEAKDMPGTCARGK